MYIKETRQEVENSGPFQVIAVADIAHQSLNPAEVMAEEDNPWKIDGEGNLYLGWDRVPNRYARPGEGEIYWIPAARVTDEEIPDWLAQVAGKTWATHEILGGLCRAFELLVGFRRKKLAKL